MKKIVAFAAACLAVAFMLLVPTAPAAAAGLFHLAAHPSAAAHSLPLLLSILAVPAPRALVGRVRAEAPTDPKELIAQLQTAFAEFKTQNDTRLKQVEGRGEDPITAEQVEKINTDLTALTREI